MLTGLCNHCKGVVYIRKDCGACSHIIFAPGGVRILHIAGVGIAVSHINEGRLQEALDILEHIIGSAGEGQHTMGAHIARGTARAMMRDLPGEAPRGAPTGMLLHGRAQRAGQVHRPAAPSPDGREWFEARHVFKPVPVAWSNTRSGAASAPWPPCSHPPMQLHCGLVLRGIMR